MLWFNSEWTIEWWRRLTEKMAEGIKPDNVICLVTPGSARQDFLNSEVACNFNLHANNLFKWLFLRTTSTSNSMVIFGFWYNFKDIWHGLFFLSQERIRNLANTNWHLTFTLFLFATDTSIFKWSLFLYLRTKYGTHLTRTLFLSCRKHNRYDTLRSCVLHFSFVHCDICDVLEKKFHVLI